MATARQLDQILLAQRGDLTGAEAGFSHDPDDQEVARVLALGDGDQELVLGLGEDLRVAKGLG